MILDTSFLVDLMRSDTDALALLERLEAGSDPIIIPTPVLYELWEGVWRSRRPIRETEAVERTLESYTVAELTAEAAQRAGRVSADLIRQGQTVDDIDLLIAGIALARRRPVVTRNTKHFARVPDLETQTY